MGPGAVRARGAAGASVCFKAAARHTDIHTDAGLAVHVFLDWFLNRNPPQNVAIGGQLTIVVSPGWFAV